MEFTIIGIEKVSYTNKQNRAVSGYRLHLTFYKKNCVGLAVDTVFLNEDLGALLLVGNVIKIYYNKYGRVEHVSVIA